MAFLHVDKLTPHHKNPLFVINRTSCAPGVCHRLLYEEPPQLKYWTFSAKSAPIARNQPLRSHDQRNHRRHRPPTFISTIPVMVPPPGFGRRRRLWPPYQPIATTGNLSGRSSKTRKVSGARTRGDISNMSLARLFILVERA